MQEAWDRAASIRWRQIESGTDLTFSRVFLPYYAGLVDHYQPVSLLEVGCGTGHLSAALASRVGTIVALEPSRNMYNLALNVLAHTRVRVLNCSVEEYSSDERFDMVISHMCAQATDNLDTFVSGLCGHMNARSVLVLAIPHPCFYNSYKKFFEPEEYHYMSELRTVVSFTITKDPQTPIEGIPYNHRPLSRYFSCLNSHGLCAIGFDEVFPKPEVQREYGATWASPRYSVFRARRHCAPESPP